MSIENKNKSRFQFADHPWLSYFSLSLILVILVIVFAIVANWIGVPPDGPWRNLFTPTMPHLITLFVLAPYIFRIPNGRRTFHQFLVDIRLANVRPLLPLIILGVTTSAIALLSLMGTSILFRIYQGIPITTKFLSGMATNLKNDLPPASMGWIVSFPAIFEEVSCRGIFLTQFSRKYSQRTAILITALTFGLFHLLNLMFGGDPRFVLHQVIWGCVVGLFYGVMVVKADSLLPAMIFHYLVNLFMGSAAKYFLTYAGPTETTIFWTINVCIMVPVLICYVRVYTGKWLGRKDRTG